MTRKGSESLSFDSQVPNFNNVTLPPSEQVTAQEIDSYFRQELIYKRNERMGKRVKALLEEHPDKSFFFAFGAGRCSVFNMKPIIQPKKKGKETRFIITVSPVEHMCLAVATVRNHPKS